MFSKGNQFDREKLQKMKFKIVTITMEFYCNGTDH